MSPSASSPAGANATPDLSIIIVSYNTRELLLKCLESIAASLALTPALRAETIVVDNASTDCSAQTVSSWVPWARVIARNANSGFAAANNEGIAASSGRIVLLLNPDTEVLGSALAELVDCFDRHSDAGIVGGHLLNPDGSEQESCFRFPGLAQQFLDFFPINYRLTSSRLNGRYPKARYAAGRPFPIDHPLGAALMVRGETIEQVGLLDETFFMYCEEIDWCMRIRRAGREIRCVPAARITHYAGQSTRQFSDKMLVALWRSRFHLFDKHYGPVFRRVARRLVALGVARQLRKATRACARGEMTCDELDRYASAHRRVREL